MNNFTELSHKMDKTILRLYPTSGPTTSWPTSKIYIILYEHNDLKRFTSRHLLCTGAEQPDRAAQPVSQFLNAIKPA
jgi:hypothetical protein